MKHYVITIADNEKSVKAAERCIKSGLSTGGLTIEKWKATTPADDLNGIVKAFGINIAAMDEVYSRTENCIAAFLSHFSLWQECVRTKESITIFEHDAICINNISSDMVFRHLQPVLGKKVTGKKVTEKKSQQKSHRKKSHREKKSQGKKVT